jgi:hypothetical protein
MRMDRAPDKGDEFPPSHGANPQPRIATSL